MDGEEVSVDNSDPIVIQIEVHDDLEVESVAVYLDERLFAILTQSPFSISWEAIPGSHGLRVQATDRAGNTSDSSAEFTVKSR